MEITLKKERLKNLKADQDFVFNKHWYTFLGVTDKGQLCTLRYFDGVYVIFDVDAIVKVVE